MTAGPSRPPADRVQGEASASRTVTRSLRIGGRIVAGYALLAVVIFLFRVSRPVETGLVFLDVSGSSSGVNWSAVWAVWWPLSAVLATVIAATALLGALLLDRLTRFMVASAPPLPPPPGIDHYS